MSTILITNCLIADSRSSHAGKTTNVLFDGNTIAGIGPDFNSADTVVDAGGACLSPGFTDLFAWCGEPGEEWKEDIASLAAAAHAGGFTSVAAFCGHKPLPDNASAITGVLQKGMNLPAEILPLGTITTGAEGAEMAELYDMKQAGAVAFEDAGHPLGNSGLKARVMEYAANCNAILYQFPFDKKLASGGSMHEGVQSTRLGLKGIPAVAEITALQTDIELATWLGVPLHVVGISAAASVALIRNAKKSGLQVKAAVPVMNLLYTDENLAEFDENFKVLPPLRTTADRDALIEGVLDGTIDAVYSNHQPQDSENKDVEFDYAAYGASTIQTTLPMLIAALGSKATPELIARLLGTGPAAYLNRDAAILEAGNSGNFTLFHPSLSWEFNRSNSLSKGKNNPCMGQSLSGKALGTIAGGNWHPLSIPSPSH